MKIRARTVPTNFIRLDDAVTSADRFVNVRDMQVIRANHNKLVASTGMRTAWHTHTSLGPTSWESFYNPFFAGVNRYGTSPPIVRTRVLLTPHVRTATFLAYGGATKANSNVRLYPVLSRPGADRALASDEYIEATSAAFGDQTLTVTVPPYGNPYNGWREYDFSVYVNPTAIGNVISGWTAISASTTSSITVLTASLAGTEQVGDMMYFTGSVPNAEPRIITDITAVAGNSVISHEWPWATRSPIAGTDTVRFRECSAYELGYMALYENPVTAFDSVPNWH